MGSTYVNLYIRFLHTHKFVRSKESFFSANICKFVRSKESFFSANKFSMTSYDLINSKLYIYFHPAEIFYIINFLSYIVYTQKLSQFSNKQVNQIRTTARILTHHFLPQNCKPYRFFEYISFQNL